MSTTVETWRTRRHCEALAEDSESLPDTMRWFPVSIANLRDGNYIRFIGPNGRRVEGPARRLPDGSWWCNFVTLTPRLASRHNRAGMPLQRRGIPELVTPVLSMLDALNSVTHEQVMRLAMVDCMSAGEVFDVLQAVGCSEPWWAVWEHVRGSAEVSFRRLGPRTAGFAAAATDPLCAAAVAWNFGDVLGSSVGSDDSTSLRARLLAGYTETRAWWPR